MPVSPILIDLKIDGNPVKPTSLRWIQSICDAEDTLEIQSSDLSLKNVLPYTEVTCVIGGGSYLGYVKSAVVNLPTGLVTLTTGDAIVKAQDYFEMGNLVDGVYVPVTATPLSDVAYWFNFWADRMGIPYEPATEDTGRVVPVDKTWQFEYGVDIFKGLTSYAGQGYQVKADENGILHLNKYSGVESSGDLPPSVRTERTIADDWTRNEVIIYWDAGTVDIVNPDSDIPPTLFIRRAILSSAYIHDLDTAQSMALSLLDFFAGFMDVWNLTVVDTNFIYQAGTAWGDKLLISNITTFTQGGGGLVQELMFDRFCPNMWGMGGAPHMPAWDGRNYFHVLELHGYVGEATGIARTAVNPHYTYRVHGVFAYNQGDGTRSATLTIKKNGAAISSVSISAPSRIPLYYPFKNTAQPQLLAGNEYTFSVTSSDNGVRGGWRYYRSDD